MKKFLIFIALIICASMLFTSCDDVLGMLSSFDSGVSDDEGADEVSSSETSSDEVSSEESSSEKSSEKETSNEEATTKEPEEDTTISVDANIAMLIGLFNKYENVGQLYDNIENVTSSEVEVDFTEVIEELKKVEVQGSTKIDAMYNGELEDSIDLFFAIKDNNLHLSGVVNGEDGGVRMSINDSLQMVAAAWTKENGKVEVDDAEAFDLSAFMDEYKNMMEESMSQIGDVEMPIDLSDIKLGGLKASDIQYKNGKYVLKKNSIYKCIENTIDSFMDAAANEGLIDSSDMDEYDEVKDIIKKMFNKITLEVYFFVENETITGFGMNVKAAMADLAEAIGEDPANMGDVEFFNIEFEISTKGEHVKLEVEQNGYVNKIEGNTEFVTMNGRFTGIYVTWDVDIKTVSEYGRTAEIDPHTGKIIRDSATIKEEDTIKAKFVADVSVIYNGDNASGLLITYDFDSETAGKEYEDGALAYSSYDNMNLDATVYFDFSKIEKANAAVFEMSLKMVNEYGYKNSEVRSASRDEINFGANFKTTEPNKISVVIEVSEKYTNQENGKLVSSSNDTYRVEGSMEVTTKNVTLPTLDKAIIDAMEEAKKNPINPFAPSVDENVKDEPNWDYDEEYGTTAPGYDYDYDFDFDFDYDYGYDYDIDPEYSYSGEAETETAASPDYIFGF